MSQCCCNVLFKEKSASRKKTVLPIEKFPMFVLARNAIMLQYLIVDFSCHYLSSGRLREVKDKGEFQSVCGCLREVVA